MTREALMQGVKVILCPLDHVHPSSLFSSKNVDLIVIRTIHPKINSDESYQGKDALLCLLTDKVDKAVIEEADKLKVIKECKSVLGGQKSFYLN